MSPAEVLLDRLDETRQRWWLFSMLCNVILTVVVSVGTLAFFILLDVALRLSQTTLGVLFVVWVALTLGLIALALYRVIRYQRSLEAAARQAELSFPELGSNLITVVELSQTGNGIPDDFRRAALADAAARAAATPFHQAARQVSPWWRWRLGMQTARDLAAFAAVLGAVFGLILLLSLVFPKWPSSADRLLTPWRFTPQVGSVQILEVRPGDAEVLRGAPLVITAAIANPEHRPHRATLFVEGEDGNERAQTMQPNESYEVYRFAIPAVAAAMRYRLEVGDSQSEQYAISVHETPTIVQVEVTYEFPSYLQRPRQMLSQTQADLEAPQYTVAHLEILASVELSEGHALVAQQRIRGVVNPNDRRRLTLDLPLTRAATYTIHLFNLASHTEDAPRVNTIRVTPDAPPTVQIAKPARESKTAPGKEVQVLVRASDDNGLGQVRLEMQIGPPDASNAEAGTAPPPPQVQTVQTWDRLAGVGATTLTHVLTLDPAVFQAGQSVLLRAVAVDRRHVPAHGLAPQESTGPWHRLSLLDSAVASAAELQQVEGVHARLWAILQRQIRARLTVGKALAEKDFAAAAALAQEVRQTQVQIQTDTVAAAQSIAPDDAQDVKSLKPALVKLAHGEMLRAVQAAEAAARIRAAEEFPSHAELVAAAQDRVIDLLRRLLDQSRGAVAAALAEMKERPGGDLPDDVAEKLRQLQDKLEEFVKQQKRVIEATENLAKKPVEDFTQEEEQLLQELAAIEDDWARFLEETYSDFSKLPEQDFSNPSLLQELVEVQTEIKMAADALTKKTADIAVPLEQLGAEMAKELTANIEKWIPDTPDRERWSQEEPLAEDMKEAPLAELPSELEDLVGELMEEEEDLFDEMEDVSSSWADSIDKGAGWDAMDGPISNMSAKGVTGNRLPNTSEIGGRSGEGRQGKSSGEFVGDTAVGKGGRKTPSRLAPDPFVQGQVKDLSKDPVGGATGGGKESGVGGEGLEGPQAPNPQRDMQRLAQKQADLRNRAESIDLKFQVLNYHHTDWARLMETMAAVEADLQSGRYQSALRRREVLLEGLSNMKTYLEGEVQVRRDHTTNLPADIQKELLNGMEDPSPRGWEELNRKYFESLAGEQIPESQ